MTIRKTSDNGGERSFDPTMPPKAGFRGPRTHGLESFGWFGSSNKSVAVRYRIPDQRTLHRPRRTP